MDESLITALLSDGASTFEGDTLIAGPVGSAVRSDQGDLRQQVHR
jgi:hypothetical protein